MPQLYKWRLSKTTIVLLAVGFLGPCGAAVFWLSGHKSPEKQAQYYLERGVKLAENGESAKAVIELRNAVRLNKNFLPAWRSLAQIEESTQHWGDLIRSLQTILSLDPADVGVRIKLVKLLALGDRVYQALELVNTDDETNGQNAKIIAAKAAILYRLNDKLGAVREAQKALAIDPGNADGLVVLANERMASGDLKGALRILEKDTSIITTDLGI